MQEAPDLCARKLAEVCELQAAVKESTKTKRPDQNTNEPSDREDSDAQDGSEIGSNPITNGAQPDTDASQAGDFRGTSRENSDMNSYS